MPRTDLTRLPERAVTDRAQLDALLDESLVAHVGFVVDEHPVVLPTAVAAQRDSVLIHGSTGSRWMRTLATGVPASLAVTAVDALIVARSAFESSIRYRSAVLFGQFEVVEAAAKEAALIRLTEALIAGRTGEVRASTARELAATLVLRMPIARWSLKVSGGWPEDEADDVAGPAWAGVVPVRSQWGPAQAAPDLEPGRPIPPSVTALTANAVR